MASLFIFQGPSSLSRRSLIYSALAQTQRTGGHSQPWVLECSSTKKSSLLDSLKQVLQFLKLRVIQKHNTHNIMLVGVVFVYFFTPSSSKIGGGRFLCRGWMGDFRGCRPSPPSSTNSFVLNLLSDDFKMTNHTISHPNHASCIQLKSQLDKINGRKLSTIARIITLKFITKPERYQNGA